MEADIITGGGRVTAPPALVRFVVDAKLDDGRVVDQVDLWHLSDDLEEILSAAEFHPVSSMEEAAEIASASGATEERSVFADSLGPWDPALVETSPRWDPHTGYRDRYNVRRLWIRPGLMGGLVPPEQIQDEAHSCGEAWCTTMVDPRSMVDIKADQVFITVQKGPFSARCMMMHYQHARGHTKRKAAAKERAHKKRLESTPSAQELHALMDSMSDLWSVTSADKCGAVSLSVSQTCRGPLSTRSMPVLREIVPRMMEIQRALGNPWIKGDRYAYQVRVVKATLLHREAMRKSEDPFWRDLLTYLEEIEPQLLSR